MLTAEELQKQRRFAELAERAYAGGRYTFTDFLGLSERDLLLQTERELSYAGLTLFGGTEGCERVMARFGSEELCPHDSGDFPIVCVKAEPVQQKFADALTHRDLLGALMNLSIAREKLGDIALEGNVAYLFCAESVLPVILEELVQAKHTRLRCTVAEHIPEGLCSRTEERFLQIASERMDVLVAAVYRLSREESLTLFREKRVFSDGKLTENNSGAAKEGAIISVRGFGRFRYLGVLSTSKKGKLNIRVEVFV